MESNIVNWHAMNIQFMTYNELLDPVLEFRRHLRLINTYQFQNKPEADLLIDRLQPLVDHLRLLILSMMYSHVGYLQRSVPRSVT
jgi:hypothetical protein